MRKNKEKLISFIIMSYNERDYLAEAIESCLSQKIDGDQMQIIIGDDGSNDGSIELIKEYTEKYPDIIDYFVMPRKIDGYFIPSIRASNVIKTAAKQATGKYVNIISGDDYFCADNIICEELEFLETHPSYIACVSGWQHVYSDGSTKNKLCTSPRSLYFGSRDYSHISAYLFRRGIFDSGFIPGEFCDDEGMVYGIICYGKWKCIPKLGFSYRHRDGSIMNSTRYLEERLLNLYIFEDMVKIRKKLSSVLAHYYPVFVEVFENRKEYNKGEYEDTINLFKKDSIVLKIIKYDYISLKEKKQVDSFILKTKIHRAKYKLAYSIYKIFAKVDKI